MSKSSKFIRKILISSLLSIMASASLHAEETQYEIYNRWLKKDYLAEKDSLVVHSETKGEWILEEAGDGSQFIKSAKSKAYMALDEGIVIVTQSPEDFGESAKWKIEPVTNYFVGLQNQGNKNYLNVEKRSGKPTVDMKHAPTANQRWSGTWHVKYVSGPKPKQMPTQNQIIVISPEYRSDINGDTEIKLLAPGLKDVTVRCWKGGGQFGSDSVVATLTLNENGEGSFIFPAQEYPYGPITVRISGTHGEQSDNCYLQLYNTAGKRWNLGAAEAPPVVQKKGMKLVFHDDFDGPLSISKDGINTTYMSHKTGGGDFSGLKFRDFENKDLNPFFQRDSFLIIRADQDKNSAGILSSIDVNGEGITAKAPAYFECRFIAPNAGGTWPAFWTMTQGIHKGLSVPADELDIIEAYGGEGKGFPNETGYWTTSHYWNQGPGGKGKDKTQKNIYQQNQTRDLEGAGGATWFETFNTYGCYIGMEDTIYYFNDVEVARHPTGKLSKVEPHMFFINLAVGGLSRWPIDLSRYKGTVDMYVDYVRVYQEN